jgi:hypothetical protein
MAPTTLTWLGFSWRATVLNEMYVYYKSPPMLAFITSALSLSSFETFLVFCFPFAVACRSSSSTPEPTLLLFASRAVLFASLFLHPRLPNTLLWRVWVKDTPPSLQLGALHLAPIGAPQHVLDVGTDTGV